MIVVMLGIGVCSEKSRQKGEDNHGQMLSLTVTKIMALTFIALV